MTAGTENSHLNLMIKMIASNVEPSHYKWPFPRAYMLAMTGRAMMDQWALEDHASNT
jgi:NADH pyrophosphatase NudC (nudix superfamily)